MSGLEILVTEKMVQQSKWLYPLINRRFVMRKMTSKFGSTCLITGDKFPAGAEIGYVKVTQGREYSLVALVPAIQEQMREIPNNQPVFAEFSLDIEKYRIKKPSKQQAEATEIFNNTKHNLIGESRAGGGKTTMLRHLASFRKPNETFIYTAFNRKNADEGVRKLPEGVQSVTSHSLLGKVIRKFYKIGPKAYQGKTWKLLNGIFPAKNPEFEENDSDKAERRRVRKSVCQLVGLAKNFACSPKDTAKLNDIMSKYDFDLEYSNSYELVVKLASRVLEQSLPNTPENGLTYDYDDMLWWPVVLNLPMPKCDVLFADECQDFNACQLDMMRKFGAQGTRLVIVGDPFQAVYRFRGADAEAFDKLCTILDNQRGSRRVLFPVNYRCDKAIIEYVKVVTHVKDIEYCETAGEGVVRIDQNYLEIIDLLAKENDPNVELATST